MTDQEADLPHYAYIWVRYATLSGRMYVVPGYRLEQALATLDILKARDPRFRFQVLKDLESAITRADYALRVGGGQWAGPCGLLFCASGEHELCFRANVEASKWLWGEK